VKFHPKIYLTSKNMSFELALKIEFTWQKQSIGAEASLIRV